MYAIWNEFGKGWRTERGTLSDDKRKAQLFRSRHDAQRKIDAIESRCPDTVAWNMSVKRVQRQELTATQRMARCNIRNAYFAEDTDTILDAITARLVVGEKFAASCLRELLDEAIDELFDTIKPTE